jgi:hypothetical protein
MLICKSTMAEVKYIIFTSTASMGVGVGAHRYIQAQRRAMSKNSLRNAELQGYLTEDFLTNWVTIDHM